MYVCLNEFLLKVEACREASADCHRCLIHLLSMDDTVHQTLAGGAIFLPLQRLVEILGIGTLTAQDVRITVDKALQVIRAHLNSGGDWGGTVLAIQMLFVLAATTWSEEEELYTAIRVRLLRDSTRGACLSSSTASTRPRISPRASSA